jgi:hypothetical protein
MAHPCRPVTHGAHDAALANGRTGQDKVLLKACWRRLMRSWPLRSLSADYSLTANDGPMADFFIERDAVSDLSLQSFDAFLKRIETSTDNRKKAVFAKGQYSLTRFGRPLRIRAEARAKPPMGPQSIQLGVGTFRERNRSRSPGQRHASLELLKPVHDDLDLRGGRGTLRCTDEEKTLSVRRDVVVSGCSHWIDVWKLHRSRIAD